MIRGRVKSALEELQLLNVESKNERLKNLTNIVLEFEEKDLFPPFSDEVNNHVHSSYSFSPYSPSAIAFMARMAGLKAVGIMDHDSVSGAEELIEACRLIGIASTVGCELRVNMNSTSVEGFRTNNPDSENISYIALHGIPHQNLKQVSFFLQSIRYERNKRNAAETKKLNKLVKDSGIPPLDYERDVLTLSMSLEHGGVTERHILFAFAAKVIASVGKGRSLVDFLATKLSIEVSGSVEKRLLDENNEHYQYDLLGLFKSTFVDEIFIQPNSIECPNVFYVVEFANSMGAIPCYAYLGDVEGSVTGDKKVQKFEDDFIEQLIPDLSSIGFKAVTYMPPRNNREQLSRLIKLCRKNLLIEISGVDINSSRQPFNCPEVMQPEYKHLIDSTWALIEHEMSSSEDINSGLFFGSERNNVAKLDEAIESFARRGKLRFENEIRLTSRVPIS